MNEMSVKLIIGSSMATNSLSTKQLMKERLGKGSMGAALFVTIWKRIHCISLNNARLSKPLLLLLAGIAGLMLGTSLT